MEVNGAMRTDSSDVPTGSAARIWRPGDNRSVVWDWALVGAWVGAWKATGSAPTVCTTIATARAATEVKTTTGGRSSLKLKLGFGLHRHWRRDEAGHAPRRGYPFQTTFLSGLTNADRA